MCCSSCKFLTLRTGADGSFFLSKAHSDEYIRVFKAVRIQHILNDKPSLVTIEADKIIPDSRQPLAFMGLTVCYSLLIFIRLAQ